MIGQSVQGRDITAYRMGDPDGRPVLLVGVIHGDEAKGYGITQLIRTMPTPPGIDLWIIDSINPDGQAANTRQNANGVDLNRNVSYNWNYIPQAEDNGQYSGEAPADQPETQALEAFVTEIQPNITIFWHQDANRVSPGGARRVIPDTLRLDRRSVDSIDALHRRLHRHGQSSSSIMRSTAGQRSSSNCRATTR